MRKKLLIIYLLLCLFIFDIKVDAMCYDDELNEWASTVNLKFIDFDKNLIDETTGEKIGKKYDYAYIIALDSTRKDIVMKATSDYDDNLVAQYIPGHKVYGIMNYNAPGAIHYDITIYGTETSACPNEIIKTFKYDLEPFNEYSKMEICNEYPDAPLCDVYKDTSKLDYDNFKMDMEEYIEDYENNLPLAWYEVLFNVFCDYILFILIPFIIIAIVYFIKIRKIKLKERDR